MPPHLKLTALLLTVSMLSACGGGGGGDPVDPPPVDPTPTLPTRDSTIADKMAFAEKGSKTVMNWVQDPDSHAYFAAPASSNYTAVGTPWNRIRNCSNGVCVQIDRLAGSDIGLVQYTNGSQDFIYDLAGKPVSNITLPSGQYNGPLEIRYRRTADGQWMLGTGDMGISLDMANGEALFGGIVDYKASDGSDSSIEIYADGTVKNGELIDNGTTVHVNRSGVDQQTLTGEIGGYLSHGTNADAIIGTVEAASNSGFQMTGGFISTSCLPGLCD